MLSPSGIGLIVFGAILLLFREPLKDYQHFVNRSRGMGADDTEEQDRVSLYGPGLMILIGIGAIVVDAFG